MYLHCLPLIPLLRSKNVKSCAVPAAVSVYHWHIALHAMEAAAAGASREEGPAAAVATPGSSGVQTRTALPIADARSMTVFKSVLPRTSADM